jgi:hypothetical protein
MKLAALISMVRSIALAMLMLTAAHAKRTAAPAKEPPPAPPAKTEVEQAKCNAVVEKNKPAMKACYQRAAKHEEKLRVKVIAKLKIADGGQVSEVAFADSQIGREEIGQCLSDTIRHWEFPASSKEYAFEFPVVLLRE